MSVVKYRPSSPGGPNHHVCRQIALHISGLTGAAWVLPVLSPGDMSASGYPESRKVLWGNSPWRAVSHKLSCRLSWVVLRDLWGWGERWLANAFSGHFAKHWCKNQICIEFVKIRAQTQWLPGSHPCLAAAALTGALSAPELLAPAQKVQKPFTAVEDLQQSGEFLVVDGQPQLMLQ